MRNIFLIIVLLSLQNICFSQKLPDRLSGRPDGINMGYFSAKDTSCQAEIFVGDSTAVLIMCGRQDYKRVDISSAKSLITQLKEIFTLSFIDKLSRCCERKDCPDTNHGYFLRYKKGEIIREVYLDVAYSQSNKCGNDKLDEIVTLFNKLRRINR